MLIQQSRIHNQNDIGFDQKQVSDIFAMPLTIF